MQDSAPTGVEGWVTSLYTGFAILVIEQPCGQKLHPHAMILKLNTSFALSEASATVL